MISMKRISFFFLVIFIISASFSPTSSSEEISESIEQLLTLPEDQIDIGRACLLFAKEAYPDLDVDEYSKKLDVMVEEVKELTGNNITPDHRIRALNTYLYLDQGFHYDNEDPYGQRLKNRYINGLMDTKSGSCITMPLLYLALAQRLGYPVYPVSAPQHLFLRYVDPKLKMQNIEATNGGGYSPDEAYINDMEIPQRGIETGAYMKTMSYRELLAELFVENAGYWARKHNGPKATRYYEISLKLNPRNAEVYRIYGNMYFEVAKLSQVDLPPMRNSQQAHQLQSALRDIQEYNLRQGRELHNKAIELGAAPPLPKNYWIIQEQNRKE